MSTSGELAMAILCLLGVITVKGDTIQVGNEIKESSNVFSSGGRAFLLQLVFPADGIVVAWTSYYQNTRPASYQIWRPVGGANNNHFQLVHDVVVMPTTKLAEETTPYYAIKNASCIEVKSGDRVGIFIRKVPGSTTFLYDINAKTLMNKYSDPSLYPALGDLVTFDPLAMPLYFSLRLDLDIGRNTNDTFDQPNCSDYDFVAPRTLQPSPPASRRSRCEVRLGSLNVGTMSGKGVEMAEMMERRRLEVLCIQETKWKGDRARTMMGGYKLLHAGGDGRSNGVGIIVSEEISKTVVRVERWKGRIVMTWLMIRKQMMCVMSVYGPQTGRMEAEKEEFRDALERMIGLVELEVMLCIAGDFNAHVGVVETREEESVGKYGWGVRNREGRALVELVARNGLAVASPEAAAMED
ncbi:hypothetical protein LSAT2_029827 [Lamellibrachia satsuma]|nr:hypothetical protein LSAT2_029827 [Lamellibrachia satsuma]